ncbi:MAG: phosphatase PAP2 family protein [Hyphomicrobiaceae bacterium]|nr:phosphatase PAP2 family protein [Hyphomicrobiaceae bacterium]
MQNDDTRPSDFVDNPDLPGAILVRHGLVAATLGATAFLAIWLVIGLLTPGGLAAIDHNVQVALHGIMDPNDPIGPAWLEGAMRDVSALGSNTVVLMITLGAAALLVWLHRLGPAVLLTTTMISAFLLNAILKGLFDRQRPDFLAASVNVESASFPSSHAMLSAVLYLLLAAIVARELADKKLAIALMTIAGGTTILVGATRVYLGAHWPSDVLAGWLLGSAIALASWQLARSPAPPPEPSRQPGLARKDKPRA